jgi:hypothetical protein
MHHDCDWVRPFRRGQAQFAKLQWVAPVGNAPGSRRNWGIREVERTPVLGNDRAGEQRDD